MYPIQHLQPTDQGYHTFLWRGKSQNIQHRHSACTEVVTTKVTCKGQIISKCILVSSIFSKKTNERIRLYYYETSSRLVFVRFWGEIEDTKKPFRNDLTFSKTENTVTAIDARTYRYMGTLSKFRYSEKATKFCKIYTLLLTGTKGQIISKWFFGDFDFLQKTNKNKSTWGIIVVKLNSFVCSLEEIEDTKKHFEIIWPLTFLK